MDRDTTCYRGKTYASAQATLLDGDLPPPRKVAEQPATFRPTALARIPAGPHFTHNAFCRLGSARRAALVAILPELPPV